MEKQAKISHWNKEEILSVLVYKSEPHREI